MNNRVTRGASFNRTNPADADLLAWLDGHPSPSDAIKAALRVAAGQPPVWPRSAPAPETMTSQELGQLIAELASLKQRLELLERQGVSARQAVSTETPQDAGAPAPGLELRQEFLDAVRKVARPGIRLEE